MSESASRYAMLSGLSTQTSSEARRDLLRQVTDALGRSATPASDAEFAQLDSVLSTVAQEYSVQVRTEFARLVAASATRFCQASEQFALDDIAVAAPVLRHSQALSEDTLLKVVHQKSQAHMLAVTQRSTVSPRLSHALVERGDDTVVTSLLSNRSAQINDATYDVVARRAETSPTLQKPLVQRQGVPMDLLNDLYHRVEGELKREILQKFETVPPGELEKAFERSRSRVTQAHRELPQDFAAARKRLATLEGARQLVPPVLATLLREGPAARTAFKLALARLSDVDFEPADRCIETGDLDTLALLCRGGGFDRALFVTLAVGLDRSEQGLGKAEAFGKLYESVPVQAAQRALRFWKVRAA
jgi:uncharacterized protein (DUF2336 family)